MSEVTESTENRAGKPSWDRARRAAHGAAARRLRHFFGLPWTWLPRHNRYSEFRSSIYGGWAHGQFLADTWIPSIRARRDPRPTVPERPVLAAHRDPARPDHNGSYTTFPDEAWFFVNGIMTNDAVAQINTAYSPISSTGR